ncbi:IS30 family transposase [bacterium]|nr:IS30 family transposase [bacterium]
MDTVIGRTGGPVLVTMAERRSRFTLIRLVPSKEATVVTAAILEATMPYRDKVLSPTYDNGKEFAMHELLTEIMEAQAYFAHPYHSWERGLNENTNGLIRQYFPKKTRGREPVSASELTTRPQTSQIPRLPSPK